MYPCLPRSSGLFFWSVSFAFRPPPFVYRPLVVCSSVLLSLVTLARAGRGSPVFDTDSIPDPTPCDAITFSWAGGVPPYMLFVGSPDTISIVSEIDDITDRFVTWTPPADTVDTTLVAFVFDGDESYDTTNEFVVQPAACLSAGPPAAPASSVSAEPSTSHPYAVSPIRSSTVSSDSPSPYQSTSTHTAPSGTPPLSSSESLAQSSNDTTSTRSAGNSTTVVLLDPTTTGTPSGTETLRPSTTISNSHWRFTSRPHRKPPFLSPSPSASEIVGMVLGSVALVGVLVGILIWRRVTVARRSTSGRGTTNRAAEAHDSSAVGLQSESSHSTLVQQQISPGPVYTKPIAHRHRISAASASPATPVPAGLGSGPAAPLDQGGDVVLHIYDDTEANSVAVAPSTSYSYSDDTLVVLHPDSSPIKPPGLRPTRRALNTVLGANC